MTHSTAELQNTAPVHAETETPSGLSSHGVGENPSFTPEDCLDDEHYWVEVRGLGHVVIERNSQGGISTRIYPLADVDHPTAEANTTEDDLDAGAYQTACRACGASGAMWVVSARVNCAVPLNGDGFYLKDSERLDTEGETVQCALCGNHADLADYTN